MDVYNDSKILNLAAWSFPSRSLTSMAADKLIKNISENGFEAEFESFEPTPQQIHYLNTFELFSGFNTTR